LALHPFIHCCVLYGNKRESRMQIFWAGSILLLIRRAMVRIAAMCQHRS
jgi:hypothetical protein